MDDPDRRIINEFCHLLEKAKQLFNGLRDLPQFGHKQWQSFFGRTFDVYTKLWKFQQQNRQTLDAKYGLKRWQIGEIASKIGQLYYHYYLRTSDTSFLNESFSFYSAIRQRSYYSKANKEERPDLMVKKLRYYARFIVVCLLLKKLDLVRDLIKELERQVEEYTKTYEPEDHLEWTLVLSEIKAFVESDSLVTVTTSTGAEVAQLYRLTPAMTPPAMERLSAGALVLKECIVVGNCVEQVKFSELTLDMFRMLQTLEREPDGMKTVTLNPTQEGQGDSTCNNPHKYLLYKPSVSQLLTFLSSAYKELPSPGAAMLLYISAEGSPATGKQQDDGAYDLGGVQTNSRRDGVELKARPGIKNIHCLHPGDLYSVLRKPLMLIVDSSNSLAFSNIPNLFGQPLVCLLAPEVIPQIILDQTSVKGSLMTSFLHSPLDALCHISSVQTVSDAAWIQANRLLNKFQTDAATLLVQLPHIDRTILQFFHDDFLRTILIRFIFCCTTLRLHRAFKGARYYPLMKPELPQSDLLENSLLVRTVIDIVAVFDVGVLFSLPGQLD